MLENILKNKNWKDLSLQTGIYNVGKPYQSPQKRQNLSKDKDKAEVTKQDDNEKENEVKDQDESMEKGLVVEKRGLRGRKQGDSLQKLLRHLLELLLGQDEEELNSWFGMPINEDIAPGMEYNRTSC